MDRYFTPFPYCVPIKGYYPSLLSVTAKKNIYNLVEKAGMSIGLRDGAIKADIVVQDGHPYIYEISNRFHGDVITVHALDFVGHQSSLESYFHTLYYDKVLPVSFDSATGKVCGWYVLMLSRGKTGRFKINSRKGLKKILIRNKENDIIGRMHDNTEVPGFVWIVGQTRDEIDKRYAEILSDIEDQRKKNGQ